MIAAKDANVMGQIQPAKSKMIEEVDAGKHTSDRVAIEVRKPKHAPKTSQASNATPTFANEFESDYNIGKPSAAQVAKQVIIDARRAKLIDKEYSAESSDDDMNNTSSKGKKSKIPKKKKPSTQKSETPLPVHINSWPIHLHLEILH